MTPNPSLLTPDQICGHAQSLGETLTELNKRAHILLAAVATHNAQPGATQLDLLPLSIIIQSTLRSAGAAWDHQKNNCKRLDPTPPTPSAPPASAQGSAAVPAAATPANPPAPSPTPAPAKP